MVTVMKTILTILLFLISVACNGQQFVIYNKKEKAYILCLTKKVQYTKDYRLALEFDAEEIEGVLKMLNRKRKIYRIIN